MQPLKGKVAFVTGAGKGIGRAIALAYAREGADVCLVGRTLAPLAKVAAGAGTAAFAIQTDVTNQGAIEQAFAAGVARFGGIDIVVINAGVSTDARAVEESDPARWKQAIEVNLVGAYLTARAAIPHLKKRGGGKILALGSGLGHKGMKGSSAYSCSKAGLSLLVQVLAEELREHGIAVNELIPGPVKTDMPAAAATTITASADGAVEWHKDPEDVVPLALFLAQQPAQGPTGQVFSLLRRVVA